MKRTLFALICSLIILSACQQAENINYYFSFMGESESWILENYEVMITEDEIKVGNGILMMKQVDQYETDSFSFSTYIVKNGEKERVHGGSVSGQADLTKQMTGAIEGTNSGTFAFEDVQHIYVIVEWWDTEKGEDVSEQINLFERTVDRPSFLNE